jgi:hypothetical protein
MEAGKRNAEVGVITGSKKQKNWIHIATQRFHLESRILR